MANPTNLKAELRIAETQTKDIAIGLPAEVDTRNGVVKGRVSRIDPASLTAPWASTSRSKARCRPARGPT